MAEQLTAAEAAKEEAARAAALKACLDYMKVEPDHPDVSRIEHEFLPAAKAYLMGAGIPEPAEGDSYAGPLYLLAVHALTLHYYEHRDAGEDTPPVPTNARPIINQLKHSSDGCI